MPARLPRVATHNFYSEHADTIESVLAYTRRAQRLSADDGDEFTSWARLRLLEDDCAILRKWQGVSSIKTFLITVVQRLFLDWRIKEWGKWRPTADARRLGPVAIELERLVGRDGIEYEQAVEVLVSKGVAVSRDECDRLWGELPRRGSRRRAGEEALEHLAAPSSSSDAIENEQHIDSAERARRALAAALPALPPQEQLIIRMRYQDGFTVARIAQLIGEEQKPLYRRIEQILGRLRAAMTQAGISREEIRELLGNPVVELGPVFSSSEGGKPNLGPSRTSNAGGGA